MATIVIAVSFRPVVPSIVQYLLYFMSMSVIGVMIEASCYLNELARAYINAKRSSISRPTGGRRLSVKYRNAMLWFAQETKEMLRKS